MRNKSSNATDEMLSAALESGALATAIAKHQYVTIYLLLILLLYGGSLFLPNPEFGGDIAFKKDGGQAKAILETLNNIATFFTTLNSALFTACGALIIRGQEWAGREWRGIDKYAFVIILVAGATSYYGLYLSHVAILEMVAHGVIDPFSNQLQTGQQVQHYAFLLGAVLLGFVIVRLVDGKRQLHVDRHTNVE